MSDIGNNNSLVAILMCTYNAEKYVVPQIESFYKQSHQNWELWVSDDGSSDATLSSLEVYANRKDHPLYITKGPGKGFARNFLSLLEKVNSNAAYYAFSDQDDVWNSEKLRVAVDWISTVPSTVPALYCSRTELTDADGVPTGMSPLFSKPPGFKNALTQSIAGGNTMVINDAARTLLLSAGEVNVTYHDWWMYLAISAVGGVVYYDSNAMVLYRQHASNLVGCDVGVLSRIARFRKLLEGQNQNWIDRNLDALSRIREHISPENRKSFDIFATARQSSFFKRVYLLSRLGLYRQTAPGRVALAASICLGKL
jgi:glycosyltransferase involved in cell wall biosynthesis